jgi:hypothetical protein
VGSIIKADTLVDAAALSKLYTKACVPDIPAVWYLAILTSPRIYKVAASASTERAASANQGLSHLSIDHTSQTVSAIRGTQLLLFQEIRRLQTSADA